ncbi:hypothetical protein KC926_03770 [Candidatus Kaiserbacteria bacterium]|nr:hypothetical protein [Candidatus Kaiserbacteria bacterium]
MSYFGTVDYVFMAMLCIFAALCLFLGAYSYIAKRKDPDGLFLGTPFKIGLTASYMGIIFLFIAKAATEQFDVTKTFVFFTSSPILLAVGFLLAVGSIKLIVRLYYPNVIFYSMFSCTIVRLNHNNINADPVPEGTMMNGFGPIKDNECQNCIGIRKDRVLNLGLEERPRKGVDACPDCQGSGLKRI